MTFTWWVRGLIKVISRTGVFGVMESTFFRLNPPTEAINKFIAAKDHWCASILPQIITSSHLHIPAGIHLDCNLLQAISPVPQSEVGDDILLGTRQT